MTKFNIFLTLSFILVLASCSSVDENMRAMIPDDAVGVVKIDVPSVLKKGGMIKGETISIPEDLKKVIDDANGNIVDEVNIIGDIFQNLSASGIDVSKSAYVYFSPGIYRTVALFPLKDEEAAKAMVAKIASGKMTEMSGILFASHLDYGYAIDDDILLIGRFTNPVAADVASTAASKIFDRGTPSLLENDDIRKCVDVENCDLSAYLDVKGMVSVYKDNSRLSTIFGDFSALDLIADVGIKAMTATVNFDKSRAKIKTDFIYDPKGDYSKLYDQVIASSNGGDGVTTLNSLPGELDTFFGIKINGSNLLKNPQLRVLIEMLESSAMSGGVDCKSMLETIDGAVVFGIGKGQLVDYNYAVAAQSKNPEIIVDEIVEAANRGGQPPTKLKGEYMYDYGYQGIALGQTEDVVYARFVDFETGYTASWPALTEVMKKSTMVLYEKMMRSDSIEGYLSWGLLDKSHGEGAYTCERQGDNVVVSMLKMMCWIEPKTSFEDEGDGYDYGF